MKFKRGLKPVAVQPTLRLADYYTGDLPSVESLKFPFGHADLIEPHMFLNDRIGDCAIAGSIEEVRLANALRGVTVNFTDQSAIENYSAITGYQPGPEIDDPHAPPNPTDQGTDVHELYDYRKNTGLVDADGARHQIVAYAGLTVGDFDELLVALSLFPSGVGIGIQVPDYCDAQFEAGQAWHLVRGRHAIEGQHYIPVVDAGSRTEAGLFTWGGHGGITAPFYRACNTVAAVALTKEMFTGDTSPTGVDFARLAADLQLLDTGPVMDKAPRGKRSGTRVSVDGVDQGSPDDSAAGEPIE
ncbi:hypothetical protein BN000_00660 [Mycobacterium europaeum]|uniref:Uncharacterized protein n=1 Tax=Mycobacterium europaeum TaxID=761804 RepID=A0A0U1CXE2_9MYCO|nr:hypothetical protein [Mycobacterium europaeum]CQD03831.1 hypothetical protein BN000_00660 [Mycobacterium europaeum]